jgi:hypothetical protein
MSEDRAILIGTTEARKILGFCLESLVSVLLAISPTNTRLCGHAMRRAVHPRRKYPAGARYHANHPVLWLNPLRDTAAKVFDHSLMPTIVYKA